MQTIIMVVALTLVVIVIVCALVWLRRDDQQRQLQQMNAMLEMIKHEADNREKLANEQRNASKTEVQSIVSPVREELQRLQQTLDHTKEEQNRLGATLEKGIKDMMLRESELQEQARQLAEALKNRGKVQGDWGEQVLEDILANSGLREGEEYFRQESVKSTTEEGERDRRPDIIVRMPDGGRIIIDSKVSLTAWADYCAAQTDDERTEASRANLRSVETHVKELARKDYQKSVDGAMPTVIMFVPNEGSYSLALNRKPEVLTEAFAKDVLIVNPTNLMLTLRLILISWRATRQEASCQAVIAAAKALSAKVNTFIEEHATIGTKIHSLQDAYEKNARRLGSTRKDSIASQLTAIGRMDVDTLRIEQDE